VSTNELLLDVEVFPDHGQIEVSDVNGRDATDVGGHCQQMRYGDLLIRASSGWKFQTMVASGFNAQL
jgi:VCBS repeat-containing protein